MGKRAVARKKQESGKKEQEWERKTGAREKKRRLGVENNRQNKYLQRRYYQLCTIVFQCNTRIDKVLQQRYYQLSAILGQYWLENHEKYKNMCVCTPILEALYDLNLKLNTQKTC